jgi:diguanylate cyclase (GGDEF)-like protein
MESNPARWPRRTAASLTLAMIVAFMVLAQLSAMAGATRSLESRFGMRAQVSAGFLQSYTEFTFGRETSVAMSELSGRTVTAAQLGAFAESFGFGPAVLLDSSGRVIAASPDKPGMLGTNLAARYPHLASALAGRPAVSNVVHSAAQGLPVVGFATDFSSPWGRRVVSGAYTVAGEAMGIFLHHSLPYPDGRSYLVDGTGQVIASSTGATGPLATVSQALARSVSKAPGGGVFLPHGGSSTYYASAPVAGTSWRVVITVPTSTLLEAATGSSRLVPWIFIAAFTVAAGMLFALLVKGREDRIRLGVMARVDPLTGLANRRAIEEHLARAGARAARQKTGLGVLMVDIDHFKQVNDRLGHAEGDQVLKAVADSLSASTRGEDVVGRWGGEEFLIVLSDIDTDGLALAAQRIRQQVSDRSGAEAAAPVTVSVGGAVGYGEPSVCLVERADAALYLAKASGRDQVMVARAILAATGDEVRA